LKIKTRLLRAARDLEFFSFLTRLGSGGGKSITAKIVSLQKSERGGERGPFHVPRAISPTLEHRWRAGARYIICTYIRVS